MEAKDTFSWTKDRSCNYFNDGRVATIETISTDERISKLQFSQLLSEGYARYVRSFYTKPICQGCVNCLPLRVPTETFVESKSQRRTLRRNDDITIQHLRPSQVTPMKGALFLRYMSTRHGIEKGGSILDAIHSGYHHTFETNYFLGDQLIGVCVIDESKDALFLNTFYYDTDFLRRGLGIFNILTTIDLARRMRKRYCYLGTYIEGMQHILYKRQFRPNEVYINGQWKPFQS